MLVGLVELAGVFGSMSNIAYFHGGFHRVGLSGFVQRDCVGRSGFGKIQRVHFGGFHRVGLSGQRVHFHGRFGGVHRRVGLIHHRHFHGGFGGFHRVELSCFGKCVGLSGFGKFVHFGGFGGFLRIELSCFGNREIQRVGLS